VSRVLCTEKDCASNEKSILRFDVVEMIEIE